MPLAKMHPRTRPRMNGIQLAGAAALLFTAAPALSQGSGAPAENWAQIAPCAQFERSEERQACVDEVFRAVGLLGRAAEASQQRVGSPRQQPEVPQPLARQAPAPRTTRPAPAAPRADVARIATTVSRAFDPGNRMLVIVTQDGQVWQQSESRDLGLPPRAGTSFTVESGALGSFICRIGSGRSFRCRRPG